MKINSVFSALIVSVFVGIVFLNVNGCAFKGVVRSKNIVYLEADVASKNSSQIAEQQLNVFALRKSKEPKEVLVFMHGGNWNAGKKSIYSYLGNRMARKGVVTVIIDYPLSPQANYNDMAAASAKAVQWVYKNIAAYGGNPDRIFVAGHSAGGHLATLIALQNSYFDSLNMANPIKGAILIDAAGLDMYGYLKEERVGADHTYMKTFTRDPAIWKAATPLYHLHQKMPPLLIYRGEKTYPSIIKSNEKFVKALKTYVPQPAYRVLKGKRHVPMITQFFWSWNPLYHEIIAFMNSYKATDRARK